MITRIFLAGLFGCCAATLAAAQVALVHVDDLEQRFAAGNDTTFVVNFWATWCKPCIAELPAFDQLHRSAVDQPIKVLLVSLDDPEEVASVVEPFLKRKGYRAECVLLDEDDANAWIDRIDESWSGAIPATLFVDATTGRRQFFESDFSSAELTKAVEAFRKVTR